ncbi:chromate transporter [Xylaria bambusicola]|uniref:chromate transporter n=1 Tax=Xylaria bambusicola TaxID=326684 RepID=UPI002007C79C|nr:chromate transporter [Xylaria bambusicola]KAI0527765.1 chromate transporter [Xylaria bambusicola]
MGTALGWLRQRLEGVGSGSWDVLNACWHMGFTSFGGPPVHFTIFHAKFVDKLGWIDEQIYQELFAVSQALTGPGSTKMLYCINLLHGGFVPAVLGFLLWSLPGALGMLGLCIGISNVGETLPPAVYALLSGLNASIVGLIALAATQLSQNAITDDVTRCLVFLGGAAGILYNAIWYFPLLIVSAGIITVVYDLRWLHGPARRVRLLLERGRRILAGDNTRSRRPSVEDGRDSPERERHVSSSQLERVNGFGARATMDIDTTPERDDETRIVPPDRQLNMSWKAGLFIAGLFFVSFIVIIALRAALTHKPILYSLFSNLYLAGTIIFGGGPVVVPLLREYIVTEGWVSPRDFLIGLAVIQAFPGPNFNFAVYLGGLTASKFGYHPVAGAFIGFVGIFTPGMVLCHSIIGLWGTLRGLRIVRSALRGFNAAAVGLIYTAVYRLWQVGYIDVDFVQGVSLGNEAFWVVIAATSYTGGAWFRLKAPVCIILGAVLGLLRYAVVS